MRYIQVDSYCKKFVEDIFLEHDYDRSNVLEKRKLKNWARDELKSHSLFKKEMFQKSFDGFFQKGWRKIERWKLSEYCIRTTPLKNNHPIYE